MKLIFACRWDKQMEKSWSGSAYAIFKEFENIYEVERFDIKDSFSVKFFKLLRKAHVVTGEPSILSIIKKYNKKYKKKYKGECQKVFQFSEVPWTENTKNYIYQDLAVEYILYLKEHDPEAYSYCNFSNLSEKELKKRAIIQRDFYEHCEGVFTMGAWLADFLKEKYNLPANKVHVVGAGINVPIVDADYSRKTGKRILFVGKDFKRKGGELVVKAFQILKNEYMKDAELYIVGPTENPLKQEISGITYVGNIAKEEVNYYYSLCDVFCMPSYFEAYGIVFCEALANGLPCIARNKFSMKEIIEDGKDGYLLEKDDENELAEKMYKLLNSVEITENVRTNRQVYLHNYSWSTVAARMENIISQ